MNAQLAVIGHRSSETVVREGGPVDITDVALPHSTDAPPARRLCRAIENALREMRVRQGRVPGDATSDLRLGLIITKENGTGLEVKTGDENLRDLDLGTRTGRETVLEELHDLERDFLTGE